MNPEFKRQLWLEISPMRLAIMPVVLALIGLLMVTLSQEPARDVLFSTFSFLFFALTAGWGSLLVVSSINSEVSERTWDQQRLSALTPWQMAWGKLLGSSIYAWYGGICCVFVGVFAASLDPDFLTRLNRYTWLLVGVVGTLALHAWLLASRLHTLDLHAEKASGLAGRLLGFLLLLQALPLFYMSMGDSREAAKAGEWWGLGLSMPIQSLVIAIGMLALGLLALWRSMGRQLMLRATPWAWALGVLLVGLVLAGFVQEARRFHIALYAVAAVAMAATYFALFTETNNRLVWQALAFYARQGQLERALQALPLWPVSWLMAALLALYLAILGPMTHSPGTNASLLGMVVLHSLRDALIYLFFAWRRSTRRPAAMTLLVLFLAGVVLPGLVYPAAPSFAHWIEPMWGFRLVFDGGASLGLQAWLAMLLHLAVMGTLVAMRWKSEARPS